MRNRIFKNNNLKAQLNSQSENKDIEYYNRLINHIERNRVKPTAIGRYKSCYTFGNQVILKSMTNIVNPAKYQKCVAKLKSLGFNTPSVVYFTMKNYHNYEVQERAKGDVLFKFDAYEIKVNTKADENELTQKCRDYNKDKLIELLAIPDEKYTELVNSLFISYKFKFGQDFHSNNILYDKEEGFSLIDLPHNDITNNIDLNKDLKKSLYDYNWQNSDIEKFSFVMLKPFALGVTHEENSGIKSKREQSIYNNLIAHKLFTALTNSNIKMSKKTLDKFHDELLGVKAKQKLSFVTRDDINVRHCLIKLGLIEADHNDIRLEDSIYNSSSFTSFCNIPLESYLINSEYLQECLSATKIDGVPALDYYKNCSSLDFDFEGNNIDPIDIDTAKSDNRIISEEIENTIDSSMGN